MKPYYEVRDDYLYVQITGAFNPSRLPTMLLEWVKQSQKHALTRILCDLTPMTGFNADEISTLTCYETSMMVVETFHRHLKLAILEIPQQYQGTQFCEDIMCNRGVRVKVTTDLADLLQWLRTDLP